MKRDTLHRGLLGLAVVLVGLVLPASAALAGLRTGIVSTEFGSCSVRVDFVPYGSCESAAFELTGSCVSDCQVEVGSTLHGTGFMSADASAGSWVINSGLFFFGPPFVGAPAGAANSQLFVTATRLDPQVVQVQGQVDSSVFAPGVTLERGLVDVAMFRYAGDPGAFDGVDVTHVGQLVALGLIQTEDVLFAETIAYAPGADVQFNYNVDVTDVPDAQLVLIASEADVTFVPASSTWSATVLLASMLALATCRLRRRCCGPASARRHSLQSN